ncbi:MAG: HAD family phosphatase [Sandaracinaceae bacterium]|nr:HAD family phosphatase [Sandaracinaceae bacterium]
MTDVLLLDVMDTLVYDPFRAEIPGFFGLTLRELLDQKHPDAWVRFEHGELTEDEMMRSFFADGRAFDHAAFARTVQQAYRWLDGVEALLGELRARGTPMHAMSNYPCWYRWIEDRLGLSRYVEWTFVSCETGLRKPALEAYANAARTLGVPPERCVFVDDRQKNVDGAVAVGMRGIRFESAAQLRRDLGLE